METLRRLVRPLLYGFSGCIPRRFTDVLGWHLLVPLLTTAQKMAVFQFAQEHVNLILEVWGRVLVTDEVRAFPCTLAPNWFSC